MRKPRSTIRVVLWGSASALLLALAIRDFQLDRVLTASADTFDNRTTAYLSPLGPPSRIDASRGAMTVVGEPIYVNLRLPRWFDRVVLELEYENPRGLPMRVGVRTHPVRWEYSVKTLEGGERHSDVEVTTDGSVRTARIPFTLPRTWQTERNVYQLILSIPGATPETPLTVRALRITAERDPICIALLCV